MAVKKSELYSSLWESCNQLRGGMAFGDNYNDVSMLDIVGHPYIMDGATGPLREKYPQHTPRPEDVLRSLL